MKGDYTRSTFRQFRHYRSVRMQQGRVQLDADWNEQLDIDDHLDRTETRDVIGPCGAPIDGGGFAVTGGVTNDDGDADLVISPGRIYVDGLLCELDATPVGLAAAPSGTTVEVVTRLVDGALLDTGQWVELVEGTTTQLLQIVAVADHALTVSDAVAAFSDAAVARRVTTYRTQPHLPDPPTFDPTLDYVAYLTVWQRHITQVEDPDLREPALGGLDSGPDTTTRLQTVWQLRLEEIPAGGGDPTCADFADGWLPAGTGGTAQLRARAEPDPDSDDICIVPPEAGYRRLEHQLYRVEIHQGTDASGATPTFKWSRDNGSVVYPVTGVSSATAPATLGVAHLGRDDYLRIAEQDVVELVDDGVALLDTVHPLHRVTAVDAGDLEVTLDDALPGQLGQDQSAHPLLRRWDHRERPGVTIAADGAVEVVEDTWLPLEAGVEVQFAAGGTYHPGDHWLVPARYTVPRGVLWPTGDTGPEGSVFQFPDGVERDHCVVALVLAGTPEDCRNVFPPLTAMTALHYVGGDGQEGLPDPAAPASRDVALPAPLQVRVTNGSFPVPGATVRFTITATSNGRLQGTSDTTADVETDADGLASCEWHLDGGTAHQVCEARLLDAGNDPQDHHIVRFHATLSTAARVAYDPRDCPDLRAAGVRTVQEAIDALCRRAGGADCCCVTVGDGGDFSTIREALEGLADRGATQLCICLMPGTHELPGLELGSVESERVLHLSLGGCGPASRLVITRPVRLLGLGSFTLSGLEIDLADKVTILATRCHDVRIDQCLVSGLSEETGIMRIHHAATATVTGSVFEAFWTRDVFLDVPDGAAEVIDAFQQMVGFDLYAGWFEFWQVARDVAADIGRRDLGDRESMAGELAERVQDAEGRLSLGEATSLRRVVAALRAEEADQFVLYDHLVSVRRSILRVDPGVALEFDSFTRPDGEMRLDAGHTHDGPVLIDGNDVVGSVSFYGAGSRSRQSNIQWLRRLVNLLRQQGASLAWADADVHLRDNRLSRLTVSPDMGQLLMDLARGDGEELSVLHRTVHCTDNVIDAARSMVVGHQVTLTSNAFSLSAVRGSDVGTTGSVEVADVVADAAVYTGNHGAVRGFGATFSPQIVNAARAEAQAANLELTFVF